MKGQCCILGIDPGFKGALAIYHFETKGLIKIWDMPVYKDDHGKTQIDKSKLALLIDSFSGSIRYAVLENVGAMPTDGRTSAFRFGQGRGIIEGILAAFMIPVFLPLPAVWKMVMKISGKDESLSLARKLFPDSVQYFERKKDDGRAEAALLAVFGERYDALV